MSSLELPVEIDPEKAWEQARRKCIGSSDAAKILGLSSFGGALDVWADKHGLRQREPESLRLRMGKVLEPIIAGVYVEQTGRRLKKPPFMRHPQYEWLGASIDRIVVGEARLVEIKSSDWSPGWGPEGTDQVPDDYYVQIQHQLLVSGLPLADCALLLGFGKFRLYHVHADPELHKMMVEQFRPFWFDCVLAGKQPSIDGSPACRNYINARYPRAESGKVLEADMEFERMAMELLEARGNFREAEAAKILAENMIKGRMKDVEVLTGDEWHIGWKNAKARAVIDWRAIAQALNVSSELIAKHTRSIPGSRNFRPYFKNEKEDSE